MNFAAAILKVLAGRSTVLSIVVVAVALSWSSGEARAGVMVPWANEAPVAAINYSFDAVGSSSGPAESAPSREENQNENRKTSGLKSLDGLIGTGGASTPTNGTSVQTASVAVAVLDVPVTVPVTRSFGYLREAALQLPHPPLGELLDPPKSC